MNEPFSGLSITLSMAQPSINALLCFGVGVLIGPHVRLLFSRASPHTEAPPPAESVCQAHWVPSCSVNAYRSAGSWWRHGCSWRCGPEGWVWGTGAARRPCRCGRWFLTGSSAAWCDPVWPPTSRRWALCNCTWTNSREPFEHWKF